MIWLITLFTGSLIYCLTVILIFKKGWQTDTVKRRIASLENARHNGAAFEDELDKPLSERFLKPAVKALANRINKSASRSGKTKGQDKLNKQLVKAGFSITADEYRIYRLIFILGITALFTLLLLMLAKKYMFFGLAIGVYIGFTAARYHLTHKISTRQKNMEHQLPDVLDLLCVSVEAGLGFEQALSQIIEHFEGPLIDELDVTYREMSMGRTRREALLQFSERCGLAEIQSFVSVLVQAGQLGISIRNVLRAQSVAMRRLRRSKIEEKAMKVSVKILIPMVMFIFPVIFIVLLGPAILNVIAVFRQN